jgi:hypothetical protein
MFSTLCSVTADISHIWTPPRIAPHNGKFYYTVHYDVIFSFGLIEFKAFISWIENVSPILVIQGYVANKFLYLLQGVEKR